MSYVNEIAEEESQKKWKFKPLRIKKMYVLAAHLVMEQNAKMAAAMKDGQWRRHKASKDKALTLVRIHPKERGRQKNTVVLKKVVGINSVTER